MNNEIKSPTIVKITIENEHGKHKLYTTANHLFDILDANELFTSLHIDAKTGEKIIHKDKVLDALKLEKPKE